MTDHSLTEIVWEGETPSRDVIARVRDEIRTDLVDLDRPGDLCFHSIMLTNDWNGPSVCIRGDPARQVFIGEYSGTTEWVRVSDMD